VLAFPLSAHSADSPKCTWAFRTERESETPTPPTLSHSLRDSTLDLVSIGAEILSTQNTRLEIYRNIHLQIPQNDSILSVRLPNGWL
jgi:hypothetical protein